MDNVILTNICDYYVTDQTAEHMIYTAEHYGVGEVLLGPASVGRTKEFIGDRNIRISVSIGYPSGCFNGDAKAEEIEEMIGLYPYVEDYYVTVAEGKFLSIPQAEFEEELALLQKAVQGRNLHIITEIAKLGDRTEDFIASCRKFGVKSIVLTTGFWPYSASFADFETMKKFKEKAGDLPVKTFVVEKEDAVRKELGTVIVNDIRKVL